MLRKIHDLLRLPIVASDGEVGHLHDLYFDDQTWTVRYFIVDTGPWLFGRRVLISPQAVQFDADPAADPVADVAAKGPAANEIQPAHPLEAMHVALTREQIENSPNIDLDQAVSRQHEVELHSYYGWLGYWQVDPLVSPTGAATYLPMTEAFEAERLRQADEAAEANESTEATVLDPGAPEQQAPDAHLRSAREVIGYNIHATNGEIGHVDDLLLEEESDRLHYLVVDTRNWLPGDKVLVAVDWVREINWLESAVHVGITRDQVEGSPLYDARSALSREFEIELYNAYDLPGYWI